jgi:DNA-binding NarL/FixJ family response regulator
MDALRGPAADWPASPPESCQGMVGIPGMTRGDGLTRIVLIGHHILFREGLREILQAEDGFTVVGAAGNHTEAVRVVTEMQPDVALLDAGLSGPPGGDVTGTARGMLGAEPGTRLIMVNVSDSASVVRALLDAGVCGCLLTSATRYDLIAAVRSVAADDERVVLTLSRSSLADVHKPLGLPGPLSVREREVMALVARGLTNGQAARQLSITEGTVKHHLRNVFAKLGATSRVDAVNRAVASSLIDHPTSP